MYYHRSHFALTIAIPPSACVPNPGVKANVIVLFIELKIERIVLL